MSFKDEVRLYQSVFHVELAPVAWDESLAWGGTGKGHSLGHGNALSNRECLAISDYRYEGVEEF